MHYDSLTLVLVKPLFFLVWIISLKLTEYLKRMVSVGTILIHWHEFFCLLLLVFLGEGVVLVFSSLVLLTYSRQTALFYLYSRHMQGVNLLETKSREKILLDKECSWLGTKNSLYLTKKST